MKKKIQITWTWKVESNSGGTELRNLPFQVLVKNLYWISSQTRTLELNFCQPVQTDYTAMTKARTTTMIQMKRRLISECYTLLILLKRLLPMIYLLKSRIPDRITLQKVLTKKTVGPIITIMLIKRVLLLDLSIIGKIQMLMQKKS